MSANNGKGFLIAAGVFDILNTLAYGAAFLGCLILGIAFSGLLNIDLSDSVAAFGEVIGAVTGSIMMVLCFVLAAVTLVFFIFGIVFSVTSFKIASYPIWKAKFKKNSLLVMAILTLILALLCLISMIISLSPAEGTESSGTSLMPIITGIEMAFLTLNATFKLVAFKKITAQPLPPPENAPPVYMGGFNPYQ